MFVWSSVSLRNLRTFMVPAFRILARWWDKSHLDIVIHTSYMQLKCVRRLTDNCKFGIRWIFFLHQVNMYCSGVALSESVYIYTKYITRPLQSLSFATVSYAHGCSISLRFPNISTVLLLNRAPVKLLRTRCSRFALNENVTL